MVVSFGSRLAGSSATTVTWKVSEAAAPSLSETVKFPVRFTPVLTWPVTIPVLTKAKLSSSSIAVGDRLSRDQVAV